MRVSAPFLVVLAGFGFATTVPAPVLAWQTHLAATNGEAFALAVAFGPNGSVVAGGIGPVPEEVGAGSFS